MMNDERAEIHHQHFLPFIIRKRRPAMPSPEIRGDPSAAKYTDAYAAPVIDINICPFPRRMGSGDDPLCSRASFARM